MQLSRFLFEVLNRDDKYKSEVSLLIKLGYQSLPY